MPQDVQGVLNGKELPVAWCSQPHAEQITFVEKPGVFPSDGLVTTKKNMVLVIRTADCLPLFFCSQKNNYIGLLHLGWKSLNKGILKTLAGFLKDKGCGKITFVAGPGLRKCCYEVKEDFLKTSLSAWVEKRSGKYFFDPLHCVRERLHAHGIDGEFHDTGICTFCTDKPLFSYRKDKTDKRTLSFIVKALDTIG